MSPVKVAPLVPTTYGTYIINRPSGQQCQYIQVWIYYSTGKETETMEKRVLFTIPVRSSISNAPRLHQSQASVILDTPPISVGQQQNLFFTDLLLDQAKCLILTTRSHFISKV